MAGPGVKQGETIVGANSTTPPPVTANPGESFAFGSHMAMGNEKRVVAILFAATLFKILCNYILIPKYGPTGAASAAVLTESIIVVLYIIPVLLRAKDKGRTAVAATNERS